MRIILDTSNKEWNEYLRKLPRGQQDIYFTREYYCACERNGEGKGILYIYIEDENIVLYPFLINEITGYDLGQTYYDIQTAYGYGGPTYNCMNKEFWGRFEMSFIEYCKENNIICEFIRFHPLLENQNVFTYSIETIFNRETVYVELKNRLEDIWMQQISSKNRNMIRKAEKNNLFAEEQFDIIRFKGIYEETMNKLDADSYFYFTDQYYEIVKEMNVTMLNVKKDKEVIATALFMKHGDYFHYHLAGSDKMCLSLAPNNLLLWKAIELAKNYGCSKFHLGGGTTGEENDSLFKFKKDFSKFRGKFYIGKRVHNEQIYRRIIRGWEEKNKREAKLLLQYRE